MNWSVVFNAETLTSYGWGILTTVKLWLSALAMGGILAFVLALVLNGKHRFLRRAAEMYTFAIRGTPMLLQIYIIYFGLSQLDWVQARWDHGWPWRYLKDAYFCLVLACGLCTAAYTAEILAGAMRETNAGEIEAAQAFGMSKMQVLMRVVLPSAIRRALPAYGNEVVMMLHATSLAYAVPAVHDVTAVAKRIYSDSYRPFEAYLSAAVVYLCLTLIVVAVFRRLERHLLIHLAPR